MTKPGSDEMYTCPDCGCEDCSTTKSGVSNGVGKIRETHLQCPSCRTRFRHVWYLQQRGETRHMMEVVKRYGKRAKKNTGNNEQLTLI